MDFIPCEHVRQARDLGIGADGYVEVHLADFLPCSAPGCPASLGGIALDVSRLDGSVTTYMRELTPDGWRWRKAVPT